MLIVKIALILFGSLLVENPAMSANINQIQSSWYIEALLIIGSLLGGSVWFASIVRDREKLTRSEVWAGFFLTALAVYFFGNLALEYSSLSIRIIWVGQAMMGHFGEALYIMFDALLKRYTGHKDIEGK